MGPIGSAVLTFIRYKKTDRQTDKLNLYIDDGTYYVYVLFYKLYTFTVYGTRRWKHKTGKIRELCGFGKMQNTLLELEKRRYYSLSKKYTKLNY